MDKGGVYTYVQDMIGGPGLFSSGGNCVNTSEIWDSVMNLSIVLSKDKAGKFFH